MPLRLTLRPHERVVIAGAVVQNGESRTTLCIENAVPVLRETDILRPSDVKTPCERIVLAVQLMYLDGERCAQHRETLNVLIADVHAVAPSLRALLAEVMGMVERGELYKAVKRARRLRPREREILSHVP